MPKPDPAWRHLASGVVPAVVLYGALLGAILTLECCSGEPPAPKSAPKIIKAARAIAPNRLMQADDLRDAAGEPVADIAGKYAAITLASGETFEARDTAFVDTPDLLVGRDLQLLSLPVERQAVSRDLANAGEQVKPCVGPKTMAQSLRVHAVVCPAKPALDCQAFVDVTSVQTTALAADAAQARIRADACDAPERRASGAP